MSAEKNQMKQEIQAAAAAHKQEFEKVSAFLQIQNLLSQK